MKASISFFLTTLALWQSLGIEAARTTENMICSGSNNACTNTDSHSTQNSISNQVQVPVVPRTVGAADLFYGGGRPIFSRATATRGVDSPLATRAPPAKAPKPTAAAKMGGPPRRFPLDGYFLKGFAC